MNGVAGLFIMAAIISQIKPAKPAVKYDAAETILSIGYGFLEVCNNITLSLFFNIIF